MQYTDNQISWLKNNIDSEIQAMRQAVDKADATNLQKFETQNEWRSQFKDQTATFVTRRELTGAVLAILTLVISLAAIIISYKK